MSTSGINYGDSNLTEEQVISSIRKQVQNRPVVQSTMMIREEARRAADNDPGGLILRAHRQFLTRPQSHYTLSDIHDQWNKRQEEIDLTGLGLHFLSSLMENSAGKVTGASAAASVLSPASSLIVSSLNAALSVALDNARDTITGKMELHQRTMLHDQLDIYYQNHGDLDKYFHDSDRTAIRHAFGLDPIYESIAEDFSGQAKAIVNEANIKRVTEALELGQLQAIYNDLRQDDEVAANRKSLAELTKETTKAVEIVGARLDNFGAVQLSLRSGQERLGVEIAAVRQRLERNGIDISQNTRTTAVNRAFIRQNRRDLDYLSGFLYENAAPEEKLRMLKSSLSLPGIDRVTEQQKIESAIAYQTVVSNASMALSEGAALVKTLNNIGIDTGDAGKVVGIATTVFSSYLSFQSGQVFSALAGVTTLLGGKSQDVASHRHGELVRLLTGIGLGIAELDVKVDRVLKNQMAIVENQKVIMALVRATQREMVVARNWLHEDVYRNRQLIIDSERVYLSQAQSFTVKTDETGAIRNFLKCGFDLPSYELLSRHFADRTSGGADPWTVFERNLLPGPPREWLKAKYHYSLGEGQKTGNNDIVENAIELKVRDEAYRLSFEMLTAVVADHGLRLEDVLLKAAMPMRSLGTSREKYAAHNEVGGAVDGFGTWCSKKIAGEYLNPRLVIEVCEALLDLHKAWPVFHDGEVWGYEALWAGHYVPETPKEWFWQALRLVNLCIVQNTILSGEVLFGVLEDDKARLLRGMDWSDACRVPTTIPSAISGLYRTCLMVAVREGVFGYNLAAFLVEGQLNTLGLVPRYYQAAYVSSVPQELQEVLGLRPDEMGEDGRPFWALDHSLDQGSRESVWYLRLTDDSVVSKVLLPLPEDLSAGGMQVQYLPILDELIDVRAKLTYERQWHETLETLVENPDHRNLLIDNQFFVAAQG